MDVDSLSLDDFCWAQEVEEIVMCRQAINNKMVKYRGKETRKGWWQQPGEVRVLKGPSEGHPVRQTDLGFQMHL